jgi:hypothetical protein
MKERTNERRDLFWKQLDRASNDVREWPSYLKAAFPQQEKPKPSSATRPVSSRRKR